MNNLKKALGIFVAEAAEAPRYSDAARFRTQLGNLCAEVAREARWRSRLTAIKGTLASEMRQLAQAGAMLLENFGKGIGLPQEGGCSEPLAAVKSTPPKVRVILLEDPTKNVPLDVFDIPEINPDNLLFFGARVSDGSCADATCEIGVLDAADHTLQSPPQRIQVGSTVDLCFPLPEKVAVAWKEQLKAGRLPFVLALSYAS